ncbi:MAG: CoA-binding protein [Candidatus Chloroheliales bacterium]|nr:MAG: CoA-binding protein [Chloroflexota bacterium]
MSNMDEAIEQALAMKNVAIVGLSNKPDRPSNHVGAYLAAHGYQIVPVNPTEDEVLGLKAYPSISDIPADVPIEVVDIFRRGEDTPPIVEQAIARGAKAVWLQQGITNEESRRLAEEAGMLYVEDHCMRREHIKRHDGE